MINKVLLLSIVGILLFVTSCITVPSKEINIYQPKSIEDCRGLEEEEHYSDFQLIDDRAICLANYGKIVNNYSECNKDETPYCMGGVAFNSKRLDICKDEACFLGAGLVSDQNFCETAKYNKEEAWILNFEKEARNICKFGVAISKKDKSICNSLDEQMRYFCQINLAKITKDVSICESMEEGLSYECFLILALEKKDRTLCKRAGERQKDCEDIIVKKRAKTELNPNKCYKLEDYYEVAECVTSIATNKSNEKLCENLQAGFGKVQEECYAKVAMSKNNITLCEKSIGSSLDNACYSTILGKSSNPLGLCNNLGGGLAFTYCVKNINCEKSSDKDNCNKFISASLDNPEVCEHQLNDGEKTDCYTKLAIKLNSPALCLKAQKNVCLINFAISRNNSEVCKLDDGFCYIRYAREYNDVNTCYKITDSYRSECFREFAIRYKDIKLCEEINDKNFKDNCIEILSRK